ncbi:MAG: GNAT family N-acetyltransferase [Pseudomonadota bacterium]
MSAPSLLNLLFPSSQTSSTKLAEVLRQQGFGLRAAEQPDLAFLRTLYETLRADDLASLEWPEATRRAFLDSQFAFQHHHFTTHFERAEFLVLQHHGDTVGRLYLLREPPRWLIVDIALLPAWQGRGIGTTLLQQLQQDAQDARTQGLALHVRLDNPRAHALYARLGFREEGVEGMHRLMHWDVPSAVAQLKSLS